MSGALAATGLALAISYALLLLFFPRFVTNPLRRIRRDARRLVSEVESFLRERSGP